MISTIVMGCVLLFATNLAPLETQMAVQSGIGLSGDYAMIGNLDRANLISWLTIKLFSLF
jgi:PTS system galactitol-specific IIC component